MGTLTVGYFDQFSSIRRLNSFQTRYEDGDDMSVQNSICHTEIQK